VKVPLVDFDAQQQEINAEVRAGIDVVFASTAFVGGPDVTAFEQEYAAEATLGMGGVLVHDLPRHQSWAGVPAARIDSRRGNSL